MSIRTLAENFKKIGKQYFGYNKDIVLEISKDKDYLTDNPDRRCPNINKAKNYLAFEPQIDVEQGVKLPLFLKECES